MKRYQRITHDLKPAPRLLEHVGLAIVRNLHGEFFDSPLIELVYPIFSRIWGQTVLEGATTIVR